MKKLTILSTLFIVLAFNSQAQEKPPAFKKTYYQIGIGPVFKNGGVVELSMHGVLQDDWMLGLSYMYLSMDPKNLPSDFSPGFESIFSLNPNPFVSMSVFSFTAGKYIPISKKIWFSPEAGISLVLGQTMKFSKKDSPSIWEANYNNTTENKTAVGGIIKADFNWALSRAVGLGLSGHANLNAIQSSTGIEFKLIFGNLVPKKK